MIKKLQNKLKSKKGFTLIELLIVIAVLGIIAAIAVPRFTGVLGDVKTKADLRAAELFANEVSAELTAGGLTLTNDACTIAAANDASFGGQVPASQVSKGTNLKAVVGKETNATTYKIDIIRGTTTIYTATGLAGPLE